VMVEGKGGDESAEGGSVNCVVNLVG